MKLNLPTDAETNQLFEDVAAKLCSNFGYTAARAAELIRDYYAKFRDEGYCDQINIPTQDDDFFFHEGVWGMAMRVHYYIGLNENPNPIAFIEWRSIIVR